MDIKALKLDKARYIMVTLNNGIQLRQCAIVTIADDHLHIMTNNNGSSVEHHIPNEAIAMISYDSKRNSLY